jgi:hypothetical protein
MTSIPMTSAVDPVTGGARRAPALGGGLIAVVDAAVRPIAAFSSGGVR